MGVKTAAETTLPAPVDELLTFERMREGGSERHGYIWLDRNERVDPFPDWFVDKVRNLVKSSLLSEYPATDELEGELAAATGLAREQLLVTPGNDPAIKALYQAYVRPADPVVMLDPTYAMVEVYASMFGARALKIRYDDELRVDLGELVRALDGARVAVIANPNQPTGTLLSDDELRAVLERAGETQTLVMIDEAYWLFADHTALPLVAEYPNLLIARSFSKVGFAGIRIGFLAGDARVITNLFKVRSAAEVNAFAIGCARLLLAHPEVEREYRATLAAGRERLEQRVSELGLIPLPSYTNFVQIRMNGRGDPREVVEKVRAEGWLIKAPPQTPALRDCIRVTLARAELMDGLADALAHALR